MLNRLILVMLLIVMPCQLVWAASSSYCGHEQGIAAQHLGHHAHQHQDDDNPKGKTSGGVDEDCAACHLGGMTLPPAVQPVLASLLPSINVSLLLEAMSSVPSREPERPKWAFSA